MYDIFLASMYLKCNENFRNYEIAIHVIFLKIIIFLFYQESIADFQDGVIVHFFINLIATNYCLDNQFLRLKIFQGRFVTIQERIPSNFAQKFQTQSVKPCTTIQADNCFALCFKNEILLRKTNLSRLLKVAKIHNRTNQQVAAKPYLPKTAIESDKMTRSKFFVSGEHRGASKT